MEWVTNKNLLYSSGNSILSTLYWPVWEKNLKRKQTNKQKAKKLQSFLGQNVLNVLCNKLKYILPEVEVEQLL